MTIESDASNEEDDQYDVREDGGEVDDLARRLHALDQRRADDDPGEEETENELPTWSAQIVDTIGKRASKHLGAATQSRCDVT